MRHHFKYEIVIREQLPGLSVLMDCEFSIDIQVIIQYINYRTAYYNAEKKYQFFQGVAR